jgi:hypothetical protein
MKRVTEQQLNKPTHRLIQLFSVSRVDKNIGPVKTVTGLLTVFKSSFLFVSSNQLIDNSEML